MLKIILLSALLHRLASTAVMALAALLVPGKGLATACNFNRANALLPISSDPEKCCTQRNQLMATARASRLGISLVFGFALLMGSASSAQAAIKFCSEFGGVIDGNLLGTSPVQVTIDTHCTFINWPASNPLTATINFQTNDPSVYLITFDRVWYSGNMACSNIDHKLWVVNTPPGAFDAKCQDLFIPVEKVGKESPAPYAAIGVPFIYTLTIPVMYDPATGTVVGALGSANDLGNIKVTDDLNATGAALTLVGTPTVTWEGGGAVAHTFTNAGGLLTFDLPNIPAGAQIVIQLPVVLDDTPANTAGTVFTNTANWWFSRSIDIDENGLIEDGTVDLDGDGDFEVEFFDPLPGEAGIAQPMTIAEPNLVVTKTSSSVTLNLSSTPTYTIDVQNSGGSDAWNITILDNIPIDMCDYDPRTAPGISTQIVAADGATLVSTLTEGVDYSLTWSAAPICQLSLITLDTPIAKIEPSQHLLITYQSRLNATVIDGTEHTNVAGATQWFSGDSSVGGRRQYGPFTLSVDGTPTTPDYQDSETVTAALSGYYFLKSVENRTTGAYPATTAFAGDTLRYTLQIQNFNVPVLNDITIIDDLGDLNAAGTFIAGMANVTHNFPVGTDVVPCASCGTGGAPKISISNLNLGSNTQYEIYFDVILASNLNNGTNALNQASLTGTDGGVTVSGVSDDPHVNGPAKLTDTVPANDPTAVLIQTPGALAKVNTQPSAMIGEQFTYTITVPATAVDVPLYDVRILDNLDLSDADLRFVSVSVVSGGTWSLSNTGPSITDLVIEDSVVGIDIPANGQAIIEITVELLNTATNQSGLPFNNSASYTYNRVNGDDMTQTNGVAATTGNMSVVEPTVTSAAKTVRFFSPASKDFASDPATVGDVLEYVVTLPNSGDATAFDTTIVDTLPATLSLVTGSATAQIYDPATTSYSPVAGFNVNPTILPSGALAWGVDNGDYSLDIPAGKSLVLTYQVTVESATEPTIVNSVTADWSSREGANTSERTGAGCPLITAPDDYCIGPIVATTINTVDNTAIAKAIVTDSYAEPTAGTDPIVRVGDTVTYELTLSLQEYTTRNVVVEDVIPTGMVLESPATITASANSNFIYTLTAQPAAGATGTLRWEFGDIVNTPNGSPLDQLVIQYVARVVTDATPVGVDLTTSNSLDNLAKLSYTGGDPVLDPARLTATDRLEVRQPQMQAVSKVDLGSGRTGAGTPGDPYQVNIATDQMVFQLSSCNDGLAPAYGVVITDQLAPELDEGDVALTATPPVVKIGATTLTQGVDYTYSEPVRGGEMRIALQDSAPVNPSECVTVDYTIGFHSDLTAQSVWSNAAQLFEFRSLPLAQAGRVYASTGVAQVWMTNMVSVNPLAKTLMSPAEVTVGDAVVYEIKVPATPMNVALNNVTVSDTLHGALEYVGATAVDMNGNPVVLTDSVTAGVLSLNIASIPAGQQAIITVTSRIANNSSANAGVSFTNTASYDYTGMPVGTDTSGTSAAVKIIEPALAIGKTVTNISNPGVAPNAGDTLRYSITFTASGGVPGDIYSSAFDLSVIDQLSLGLAYQNGSSSVNGMGNTIANPAVSGNGITTAQQLSWSLADLNADIDVPEGSQVTITYDVLVLDTVLAGQDLTNSATVQWTSQNGLDANERTGSGTPVENDYFTGPAVTTLTTLDTTTLTKSRLTDTYGAADANVRVGDLIDYELRIHLDEGSHSGLVLSDLLPQGVQFEEVVSINGATSAPYIVFPFSHAAIAAPSITGSATTGPTTVTWNIGDVVNTGDNDPTNDEFVVIYRARVLNGVLAQANTTTLTNTATLNYTTASGPASRSASASVSLLQPNLTVLKSAAPADGDIAISAGELITYTVDVTNTGTAPAYDTMVRDTLPVGLRQGGVTTTSIVLVNAGSSLPNLAPLYDPATGITIWNLDSGTANVYTIPLNETLRITYTVHADADLGPGLTLTNSVVASDYYSFDNGAVPTVGTTVGVRQKYGPSNTAIYELQTPVPGAPLKQNPPSLTATIGQEFTYTITVPADPLPTALHDVRILDDLGALGVEVTLVGISKIEGSQGWIPVNAGTATSLEIVDTTSGIEIPANEQIKIGVTVRINNVDGNVDGDTFNNTASYTYNQIDGDPTSQMTGGNNTTANMTLVEPKLAALKAVTNATPGKTPDAPIVGGDILQYVVTITNSGSATAYDVNVVDTLPAALTLYGGFVPTATINTVAVSGFVSTPSGAPNGPLVWGRDNADGSLDIPALGTLVLTYQAQVLETTAATFSNEVWIDWTSLEGTNAYERTGAGCPTVAEPNNYCVGPASVTSTTTDQNSMTKALVADSYVDAPSTASDKTLRIGDTATYRLTLQLGEGTTRSVTVQDQLPAGMAYGSLVSITPASGSGSFTYSVNAQPAADATGTVSWDLGDVTNAPSNDGTPVDELIIEYTAVVQPDAGIAQQPTTTLVNSATLSYLDASGTSKPAVSDTLTVWQPVMSSITKSDRLGRTSPLNVNVASDTMQFRLESCNTTGQAPAYSVLLTDILPMQLNETTLTAPEVRVGGVLLNAGAGEYTYTPPLGRSSSFSVLLNVPVLPTQCVTVDYTIGFYSDFGAGQLWNNSATLKEYWSLPSQSGQKYAPLESSQFYMTNQVTVQPLAKVLLSPASGEATIGDTVVYQITVPAVPMNAALDSVVVTDTLHAALTYVNATATLNGAPLGITVNQSGQDLSLALGTIPAGQQAVITLTTHVTNNDQANAGTSITNTADYTYTNKDPLAPVTSSTSGAVKIIEPLVTVTKSASSTLPAVGDLLTYTVTFTAAGGAAGDDFSNAFDLTIEDSLSLGLLYEPGSATVNGVTLADPATNGGDGVTTTQTLTWSPANGIDIDIAEGAIATVTYQVRVLGSVAPGQTLTNSVVGRWTGLNGDQSAIERSGSGTPPVNDYVTQPATVTMMTQLAVSLVKSVVNVTTGEDPGAHAKPGETLRYTLVLTNDSVVEVNGLSLVDELVSQFASVNVSSISISAAGADSSNSSATGGINNAGVVDIRNLTLAATGDPGGADSVTITFEATLDPVIDGGTTVLNQAQLSAVNVAPTTSNQTATLIDSAPQFVVTKTSAETAGDTTVLLAGDVLRYTITVQNIGTSNAVNVSLRDAIPANTTYVPGTTRLNGVLVADQAGLSPLQNGMLIKAPEDTTLGEMAAVPSGTATNIATITFDVRINTSAIEGTYISNQGFVTAVGAGTSGTVVEQPSDDPDTTAIDDPTRDIIGNLPLLDAHKTVAIPDAKDFGTKGTADPGDTLLYTITVTNSGAVPATNVVLTDAVPADSTYVANTTQMDNVLVPDPSANVSALRDGLLIGTVPAGGSVTVTFEVLIDSAATVSAGDVISNQGYVASNELATEPTDADGDDANGDQPTIIVVGSAQQLSIVKEVIDLNGGVVLAGETLEYVVRITNTGAVDASNVVITDDLTPLDAYVSYLAGSATLNGLSNPAAVTYAAPTLTATIGDLPMGATATLRFRVQIKDQATVPIGTIITNTAQVDWSSPAVSATGSISVEVGGIPGTAMLKGRVWHDANFNNVYDDPSTGAPTSEIKLAGWTVTISRNGVQLGSATTDADGLYSFIGLAPTVGSDEYEISFSAPGATSTTAKLGQADSTFSATAFTDGLQNISGITAASGASLDNLNLPIDPSGVIFDALRRTPIAGATLTLLHNDSAVDPSCFEDAAQQNQVTLASGYYKFDLKFGHASCPASSDYVIRVTPPPGGYVAGPSRFIPPVSNDPAFDAAAQPYSVALCAGDAVGTPAGYCEAMVSELAPTAPAASVVHHLYLTLNTPVPGASQLFNNHIAIDPTIDSLLTISKTSSVVNVSRAQFVPYTITVNNTLGQDLTNMRIVDTFPAGFKYVAGSSRVNDLPMEPVKNNLQLSWSIPQISNGSPLTIKLLFIVGSGVSEGEYVNRAEVISLTTGNSSGQATATVRVVPDPTFDCTDIIGKVYDDANRNGYQDKGEKGLPGVRLATARGLLVTTDEHGRYHITCAAVPDENRGSNFIIKVDERTLPSGYRITTENPLVLRATRGKMMKFNFGATIHKVVRIDMSNGVFEPGKTDMRIQWKSRMNLLMGELKKGPSLLRVAYMAEVEDEDLVEARLTAMKQEIGQVWAQQNGGYELEIETEVFWRTGAPPDRRSLK